MRLEYYGPERRDGPAETVQVGSVAEAEAFARGKGFPFARVFYAGPKFDAMYAGDPAAQLFACNNAVWLGRLIYD